MRSGTVSLIRYPFQCYDLRKYLMIEDIFTYVGSRMNHYASEQEPCPLRSAVLPGNRIPNQRPNIREKLQD